MRHFTSLCACLVLAAAAVPAALPAQTLTFAPPKQISVDPTSQDASVYLYGDFDGNGNTDLIVEAGINSVFQYKFLTGNGSGDFTANGLLNLGIQQLSLVADFNGDGKDDIVTLSVVGETGNGNGILRVLLSDGGGKFTTGYTASLPAGDSAIAGMVGDFNKDGRPDIAVVSYPFFQSGPATLIIFLNRGDDSFTKITYSLPNQFSSFDFLSNLVTGDFEGNGNQDLAFTFYSPLIVPLCELYTFAGDGQGHFGPGESKYIFDTSCAVGQGSLFAADLNGDGRTDLVPIVGPKRSPGNLRVPSLLVEKSGKFYWSSAVYTTLNTGASAFWLADMNGDDTPDLIFVAGVGPNSNLHTYGGVYLGLGNGQFKTPHIPITVTGSNTILDPSVVAVPLKTGDLPSLIVSNGEPTLELLVNTTKK